MRSHARLCALVAVVSVTVTAAGCPSAPKREAEQKHAPTTEEERATASSPTSVESGTTEPSASGGPPAGGDLLAQLQIDDSPQPGYPYSRDDWSDWVDLDGDGCDTRREVLIAASLSPAQVDAFGCEVVAGDWLSIYDGIATQSASDLDIDHVVALEAAHTSGGWRWDAAQRRRFANDEANLIAVTVASNRSKGSRRPDEWRPDRVEAWCETATTWATVKIIYQLTVTTSERDALGQMLDTCGSPPSESPLPPAPTTTAPAGTEPPAATGGEVTYANCSEARAAGVTPLYRGEPSYAAKLDRDSDGIACE